MALHATLALPKNISHQNHSAALEENHQTVLPAKYTHFLTIFPMVIQTLTNTEIERRRVLHFMKYLV